MNEPINQSINQWPDDWEGGSSDGVHLLSTSKSLPSINKEVIDC